MVEVWLYKVEIWPHSVIYKVHGHNWKRSHVPPTMIIFSYLHTTLGASSTVSMKPTSQDSQASMETSHPDGRIPQSGAQKDGGSAAFVTVISPDNVKNPDVGIYGTPSKSSSEVVSTSVELSEDCSQQAAYHGHHGTNSVPALFVFGGMDTCGTVHSDCFVFVPSL